MAESTIALDGDVLRTYERGLKLFREDEWSLAARSFDMSVKLGNQDPAAYEYLARSYLHEAQRQVQEHAVDESRADGALAFEMATEAALKSEQKFGKERWQPSFILATILYHRQQYTLSSSHLSLSLSHPSFGTATVQEQTSATDLSEHISIGILRLRQNTDESQAARPRTNIKQALSPDILLRIVDLGLREVPGLASRLSRVCQSTRRVLNNQPRLWRTLILGRGLHGLLKVKTYLERSADEVWQKGCLKELRILGGYEWTDGSDIGAVLRGHVADIEVLDMVAPDEGASLTPLVRNFRRSMSSLRSLTIRGSSSGKVYYITSSLDLDLLPLRSSCLKELNLHDIRYEYQAYNQDTVRQGRRRPGKWVSDPAIQLRDLEILRFDGCHLVYYIDNLRDLLEHTPNIKDVSVKSTVWDTTGFPDRDPVVAPDESDPRLEHLTRWCSELDDWDVEHHLGQALFASITVPHLNSSRVQLRRWMGIRGQSSPGRR